MKKQNLHWILIFLIVSIIADILVGMVNTRFFKDISNGLYGTINATISSDPQILVLGSSTAQCHYNTLIIETETSHTVQNSGIGGYGIVLNYALLKEHMKNSIPKIVILDLAPNILIDPERFTKLDKLIPYKNEYDSFDEIIRLNKESKIRYFSFLGSVKYNSTLYNVSKSLITADPNRTVSGFTPLNQLLGIPVRDTLKYNFNEDLDIQIEYFKKIVMLCKEQNIQLLICISPAYIPNNASEEILQPFKVISEENSIPYFNYSQDKRFKGVNTLFADQVHLNSSGADAYSHIISAELLRLLANQTN